MNNKFWIGTKESDILHTGSFFQGSVTACGSGKNGNHSFSKDSGKRINYNITNDDYTNYLAMKIDEIINENPLAEIMYYNPYYAHLLEEGLQKHICCLNSKPLLNMLRSKCEMRTMASEHIPVVPFARILGKDISNYINSEDDMSKYVIQENISSGGEGTYIGSGIDKLPDIRNHETYLISKYYEKSIPININFLIFDDEIILFPPSVQISQQINGKFLFAGSDYFIEKYRDYFQADIVYKYTLKLAEVLKKMGYRGICGFDYIAVSAGVLFLECNPRFQASSFLINLALNRIGLPSVQEMNHMAFHHAHAPKFDFQNLAIPYSTIAVPYKKYLHYIMLRSEWRDNANVLEILEDGLSSEMDFENDAYLYRIVFSDSITELNPEYKVITFDNLLPPSKEWYLKVVSDDILALKISLLNQGIYIPKKTLKYLKRHGGIKASVFDSIDIILSNHMIINTPYKINYADFSPFSIEEYEGKFRLYYFGKFLQTIAFEQTDQDREQRTKENNVPYRRLAYLGGDRLRVHHTDICIFKKNKKSCRFCNLPVNRFKYTLDDIYEVFDFYLHKGGFRHILIGGASEGLTSEHVTIIKLVKYIRTKTNMPIYVMCLPISDKKILQELHDTGVTEIGFNLEVWEEKTSRNLMPGKGDIPRQNYMTALKNATEIWEAPYAVRSLLILGLESLEISKTAVEVLCSNGIMPILSVFRPLPGTEMDTSIPPSNEFLYSSYKELNQICQKYNQHLGPDCFCCQNNTLALPW